MSLMIIQGIEDAPRGIHYELDPTLDPIGVGGMGQVFRGKRVEETTGVELPAAIKFLFDDLPLMLSSDPDERHLSRSTTRTC